MSITTSTTEQLADEFDSPARLLTPEGVRVRHEILDEHVADLDLQQLADLYIDMVVVRRFDTEAFSLTRQGELALWPPLLGQEAAQVGSARALEDRDWSFGSYREHALPILRGVDIDRWLKVWKTTSNAAWDPHEHNIGLNQIIIGAQTLHAVGYAMGAQIKQDDSCSIAYFGDGATTEGDVSEAMVFASTYNAPVVFFCQNNGYAISEPTSVQAKHVLARRASGFDIPAYRVDGNDILAVLAATRLSLQRARTGHGPSFIEAVTYRMGPHTTTDDPSRYRTNDEVESWKERDPMLRVERFLESEGFDVEQLRADAKSKADALAKQLRAGAIAIEPDPAELMFDNVYSAPHGRIERQRAEYKAFAASYERAAS